MGLHRQSAARRHPQPWDPSARRAVRAAGRAQRCRRAWCRSAPRATAAVRSARRPRFTGLVGLKPNYGRIPTFGDTHLAQNAVVGCVTTTVADTALLLDVMAGPDARDRTCLPAPAAATSTRSSRSTCRAAASPGRSTSASRSSTPRSARCASRRRRRSSRPRADARRPADRARRLHAAPYARIEGVDQFVGIDRDLWQNRLDELDPLSAPGWVPSEKTLPWLAAVEADGAGWSTVAAMFDDVDLILTPMASGPAVRGRGPDAHRDQRPRVHGGMAVVLGMLANLVTCRPQRARRSDRAGLPVGLQIIGPRFREDLVLAAAPATRGPPVAPPLPHSPE